MNVNVNVKYHNEKNPNVFFCSLFKLEIRSRRLFNDQPIVTKPIDKVTHAIVLEVRCAKRLLFRLIQPVYFSSFRMVGS